MVITLSIWQFLIPLTIYYLKQINILNKQLIIISSEIVREFSIVETKVEPWNRWNVQNAGFAKA
jgi:hypothetical protein